MPATAKSYIRISLDGAWEVRMTCWLWCWVLVKIGVLVKRGQLQGNPVGVRRQSQGVLSPQGD